MRFGSLILGVAEAGKRLPGSTDVFRAATVAAQLALVLIAVLIFSSAPSQAQQSGCSVMGNSIDITEYIAKDSLEGPYSDALGSGLNYYYCRNLYNNENLFILDPNRDDPTEYIEIQDYAWLLTTLAPPPPVN